MKGVGGDTHHAATRIGVYSLVAFTSPSEV